ncbi:MAG: hypothetical protein GY749_33875 [Desulfobacteraceae bacterium]|nr:hypothetical protein [Desulfobacteraceae bacterium]
MRYAIIANPVSGGMTITEKRSALAKPAEILEAQIYGLNTGSAHEFSQCARELAERYDVIVVAGGDGTFSDIINSVDTSIMPIGYLPLGTGNALQYALNYKGNLADIALRIRQGMIYDYDLINCEEKKRAFMVSVGIEGMVIRLRDQYAAQGGTGFETYFRAAFDSYLKEYKRTNARVDIDGEIVEIKNLLSLIVVKQPYYGFGMNVVPKARFDDRQLHILWMKSKLLNFAIGGITAFAGGNRLGHYRTGQQISVKLEHPLVLQIDGNEAWESDAFTFTILPNALKIKC